MDQHGEAEASPAEQRCRNQQGDRTERDEQVLADDRSRRAAQTDGERKLAEIVTHQHDIGGFQRNVGAGATHGDAYRGAGERGPVIGAVAYHGRSSILLNEASYYSDLFLGQQARSHVFQSDRLRDGTSDALVVPSQHDGLGDAQQSQFR